MMSKPLTRLLSLVLALTMFLSSVPFAQAAEDEIVADPIPAETVVATEAPAAEETEAATEPAAEPEKTEPATEPAAEPEETEPATEPAAEPEETEPATEPEETEPATEPEETEPATEPAEIELPCGFNGMPEGYELSEAELAAKRNLTELDTVATLESLEAGKGYAADEVIFTCESEEYANMVAHAYNAELVDFEYGVAMIRLQDATALDAVKAAADMELPLPAVSPNYITQFQPIASDGNLSDAIDMFALPERQSWETWVMENLANPDPAISNPRAENYQYFHDVINSYEAWGVTTGDSDIIVAVIDSGVAQHTEFSGRLIVEDMGLGTTDDVGHGTHVAGIIAGALDNGKGGAGVAPGVTIMALKAGGANGLSDYYIAKSISYAADNGADIINMSLGGAFPTDVIREAVAYAHSRGVTIVAAMGNDGTNCMQYPAAYDGVIGVASTDATGSRAYYSNFGAWVDVCAPGSDIYSTVPGDYDYMSGTSMATPVVAGVCALYMSAVGHVSPATMESVLEKNCSKTKDKEVGAGIVDVGKMFDKIVNTPSLIVCADENGNGSVYDAVDTYYFPQNGATVTCDEYIDFLASVHDENDTLIYTINGKTPSVKNGAVVNGTLYNGPISLVPYVGTTITVRAAAVTGMGSISKVVTMKLKVEESNKVESLTITAPKKLIAGKSAQLTAVVKPDKADQAVTWSIVSRTGDTYGATITANGTLKTQAKKSGTVTVKAESKADGSKFATCTIQIETINPVATIKLDKTTASIYIGEGVQISIATLQDKLKNDIASTDCGVQWTSSNPKVATVDEYGYVTGLTKGKVTITCKVLDGSGKSAKCTVNVLQAVESITVTGNDTIPAGVSATYKAVVAPTTANSKTVIWELIGAPAGATVSAKGAVKVPKGVATGTSFMVRATAKDTGKVYGEKTVYVSSKTSAVNIGYTGGYIDVTYNKTGWVSGAKLFVSTLADDGATKDWIQLSATTVGNNYTSVSWTTSNAKVATVSSTGKVVAHNPGTATITCKALDGSGKKATVKVTVTVPVSQISIKSAAPQMTFDYPSIAFGKSVKNTVVFGDTYGKPSNTKVSWDFRVLILNTSSGKYTTEYTSYSKSQKWVTLSNGTLKTSAKMKALWYELQTTEEIIIAVTATAQDGSGVSDTIYYNAIPGATVLGCYLEDMYGRGYLYKSISATIPKKHTNYYTVEIYSDQTVLSSNQSFCHFTTTSSNPKVASVYAIEPAGSRGHYLVVIAALAPGNANITVKTADGSNLTTTIKLKVTN